MSIFIQIASYRDPELIPTIQSAIDQASKPEELSFGICYQYLPDSDINELETLVLFPRCRVIAVDSRDSKGACWARSQTQQLWNGEKYTLQVDSHTRFVKGWDSLLVSMLKECPSEKAILSTYPPAYFPPNQFLSSGYCRLAAKEFTFDGTLLLQGCLEPEYPKFPQKGKFLAAGFIFAKANLIAEVPYDPQLYFYGEEISFAIRAWTKGWDIYHPNKPVLHHYYERAEAIKHWQDHPNLYSCLQSIASERLQQLLGINSEQNLQPFGLGTERSLSEYEDFTGINFRHKFISDCARSGIAN